MIFLEKEEIIEEIRAYFEKVIGEIFGFEALDVEKPEEEQPDIENLVMIPMSQSLKSIEAIRKPDTKPGRYFGRVRLSRPYVTAGWPRKIKFEFLGHFFFRLRPRKQAKSYDVTL